MTTPKTDSAFLCQVRAAMFGHAIADAMGVPVEFMDRAELEQNPVTRYRGYGSHHVPAGTWSDDTSMALAALDSLAHGLSFDDMMQRFCDWKQNAAYTATDEVFDMGISTHQALSRYLSGTLALQCGGSGEYDNGNGSLMRMVPVALYVHSFMPDASLDARMDVIHKVSMLTHAHPRSQIACGIYVMILMELMTQPCRGAVLQGIAKAQVYYISQPAFKAELAHFQRVFAMCEAFPVEAEIQSSGYVVSTLEAALWCLLTTDSYSECILQAVNLGNDTDTVAAVAGGLAGVLYGMDGIPTAWYEGLIRKEMIETLCTAFAQAIPAQPTSEYMSDFDSSVYPDSP